MHHVDKAIVTGVEGVMLDDVLPKRDKMWWNYPKLLKLNLLLMCAIVSDITNGYDGSMLNGLQIIPGWRSYFGSPAGQRLGTISNGVRFGQIASLVVVAPLVQKYGRRVPIAIDSAILLVGVVLQTAAQNYSMFVVARILIGFGNNIHYPINDVSNSACGADLPRPTPCDCRNYEYNRIPWSVNGCLDYLWKCKDGYFLLELASTERAAGNFVALSTKPGILCARVTPLARIQQSQRGGTEDPDGVSRGG
jgi:hypothetical protein